MFLSSSTFPSGIKSFSRSANRREKSKPPPHLADTMNEDSRHKTVGVIGQSRVVEWKIAYVTTSSSHVYRSPTFPLWGCSWRLGVQFLSKFGAKLFISLEDIDPSVAGKTVTCAYGIKRPLDRCLVEKKVKMFTVSPEEIDCRFSLLDKDTNKDKEYIRSELLDYGILAITCRFKLECGTGEDVELNPDKLEPYCPSKLEALETLSSDLNILFDSKKNWDATLRVQGREFQTHRSILSARSPVLCEVFDHNSYEEQTGVMTIPDCDLDSFGHFLRYLYTGRIEEKLSFQTAYHLYVAADKYDVRRLRKFCAHRLKKNLTTINVCDVATLADRHSDNGLASAVQTFFNENYLKIIQTLQWTKFLSNYYLLADKLLKKMSTSNLALIVPHRSEPSLPSVLKTNRDKQCGGVVGDISRVLEWYIPDFRSIPKGELNSPLFLWSDCKWYLSVNTLTGGDICWCLCLEEIAPHMVGKTMTYAIGIKKADGTLEEKKCGTEELKLGCFGYRNVLFIQGQLALTSSDLYLFGTLTITCRMAIAVETHLTSDPKDLLSLSSDFQDLLDSSRKFDVILKVQGSYFQAHKALLSARCPVLLDEYEHGNSEMHCKVISDCEPDFFGHFLKYLYTGKTEEMSFQTAYHLYTTSEKFNMRQLKEISAYCLRQNMTTENFCDAITLADHHADDGLASAAQSFFNKNFLKIFKTPQWTNMLRNYLHLADKLMKEIPSEVLNPASSSRKRQKKRH